MRKIAINQTHMHLLSRTGHPLSPVGAFCYAGGVENIRGCTNMRGSYAKKPTRCRRTRADMDPSNRALFTANKKIILATQSVCAICGKPVDKSIKYPDPMSPTVDHIIPLAKNGDPISLDNLQLAHRYCNRMKSDKIIKEAPKVDGNRVLPLTENWATF